MPNVLDIRRRIRSVRNTQQITRAMKMVAAARLRRAHERAIEARPYADKIRELVANIAARVEERDHPLLVERPVQRILLVLVTADRGLCGAFNANLVRAAQRYLAEHSGGELQLVTAGRKGRDFFRRRGAAIVSERIGLFARRVDFEQARELAREIIDLYSRAEVDAVDVIYNEFKTTMVQRLVVKRCLPVQPAEIDRATAADYIYEQPPAELFSKLLPRYVEAELYRALLESQAAELAARMTAMETATNNAGDLIDSLTLHLNRVRQAAITKEIIEIVGGAAAL